MPEALEPQRVRAAREEEANVARRRRRVHPAGGDLRHLRAADLRRPRVVGLVRRRPSASRGRSGRRSGRLPCTVIVTRRVRDHERAVAARVRSASAGGTAARARAASRMRSNSAHRKRKYFWPKYAVNDGKVRSFETARAPVAAGARDTRRPPCTTSPPSAPSSCSSPRRSRAALLASKLSERISIPAAAPFLVVAAFASDIFPRSSVSTKTVERVATVALIVILFDGGLSIGWRRFRRLERAHRLARAHRDVRDGGRGRARRALGARLQLDRRRPARRRARADRPRRDVLGARRPGGRRPHRDDPRWASRARTTRSGSR